MTVFSDAGKQFLMYLDGIVLFAMPIEHQCFRVPDLENDVKRSALTYKLKSRREYL
jgi:hypothetical protein